VLVIERSTIDVPQMDHQDEQRLLIEREASYPEGIWANHHHGRPFLGSTVGGSTSLYGAVMMRPAPADFAPGRWYREHLPSSLADWPLTLEELAPYLEIAEDCYRVAGDHTELTAPLAGRAHAYPQPPAPLAPINQRIAAALRRRGLTPFMLPVAIEQRLCRRCPACPGYYCPYGARVGSRQAMLTAAQALGAVLWTGVRAERLVLQGRKVVGVIVEQGGRQHELHAEHVIVAAGAIHSAALLVRSGVPDSSGLLGCNLMFHLGVVAVAFYGRATGAARRLNKQLGWADWYLGTTGIPHKLGLVQAIPIPGPRTLQHRAPIAIPFALAHRALEHSAAFVLTLEDLPSSSNRVRPRNDGSVEVAHRFTSYDLARAQAIAPRLAAALRASRPLAVTTAIGAQETMHLAHQVGTARMGNDPSTSVVDRNHRLHGLDNLHVADGSWLPTSLGVGPSLTIAAAALRLADHLSAITLPPLRTTRSVYEA
jgi:choline dehydrogenase-like flavoprotein